MILPPAPWPLVAAFVFAGDSGYGTHEVARFSYRHRARLTLISKLHLYADLLDPPAPYAGKSRPRFKGKVRPKPRAAVAAATAFARSVVGWLGTGSRRYRHFRAASGTGTRPARAGPVTLGVRRGRERRAPGRALLHHRPEPDAFGRHRLLLRALEYRNHVPRSTVGAWP